MLCLKVEKENNEENYFNSLKIQSKEQLPGDKCLPVGRLLWLESSSIVAATAADPDAIVAVTLSVFDTTISSTHARDEEEKFFNWVLLILPLLFFLPRKILALPVLLPVAY